MFPNLYLYFNSLVDIGCHGLKFNYEISYTQKKPISVIVSQ
jgi:hypothetical protein